MSSKGKRMALGWVTRKDVDSEANILEGGRA